MTDQAGVQGGAGPAGTGAELSAETSRRVAAILRSARRGYSRDALTFLVASELHRMRPDLAYAELAELHAEVLAALADAGPRRPR